MHEPLLHRLVEKGLFFGSIPISIVSPYSNKGEL